MNSFFTSLAFLSLTAFLGSGLTASPASAAAVSVKISMGSCPIGHPQLQAGEALNKWIKEKTDGKYEIVLLPAGSIGSFDTVYQMTQMGSVPISLETSANLANIYPELAVLDLPYLFMEPAALDAFLKGDFMTSYLKNATTSRPGVRLIGANNVSFRYVASKTPIRTLAELQGRKNRISNNRLHALSIAAMGMNPTPTPSAEILSSLQQGVVDCTDVEIFWPLVGRLYDVCKYYLQMDAMPVISITCVSEAWLNQLPEADRAIWLEGLEWFQQQIDKCIAESYVTTISALKEKGCEFSVLSDVDKAEAARKCANVSDNLRPNQKAFLEALRESL